MVSLRIQEVTRPCRRCGRPMKETTYRWNPQREDFDAVFVCGHCEASAQPSGDNPERAGAPQAEAQATT